MVALPPTQQLCGLVDGDKQIHAVQKKIAGDHAACGAGRISQPLIGRFDPDDASSCVECGGQLSGS